MILKLRIAKLSQLIKANIENEKQEYERIYKEINKIYNNENYQKVDEKNIKKMIKAL